MAVNFLEELRKETKEDKEDIFFLLKNNKEKFLDKLIEDWAKEKIALLKNEIMKKVQGADYSIIDEKRVVKGDFRVGKSIVTNALEKKQTENKLLQNEISKHKLYTIIAPDFKFIRKEKHRYRDFYNEIWHEHTLELSGYAKKAIQQLEEEAKKETIVLTNLYIHFNGSHYSICCNGTRTGSSVYKFDGLYTGHSYKIIVEEICSSPPQYEIPHVEDIRVSYSLTY